MIAQAIVQLEGALLCGIHRTGRIRHFKREVAHCGAFWSLLGTAFYVRFVKQYSNFVPAENGLTAAL